MSWDGLRLGRYLGIVFLVGATSFASGQEVERARVSAAVLKSWHERGATPQGWLIKPTDPDLWPVSLLWNMPGPDGTGIPLFPVPDALKASGLPTPEAPFGL